MRCQGDENHLPPPHSPTILCYMRRIPVLLLLASQVLYAVQVYRVDPSPVMTTAGSAPIGGFPALYAVPNAFIGLYSDAAGTIPVQSYTDGTGVTQCGIAAPVVQAGTALCSQTTNPQGAFGFWLAGGTYYFTITTQTGQRYGPYPITTGTLGIGTISLANGGTSASLTAANGGLIYSTASAMAIAPPGQLAWTPSTNGNNSLAVAGNTGITPDANLFVAETFTTGSQVMVDFLYTSSSIGSDSGAMRSIAYQTGGTGNNRAGEFHMVKTLPATLADTFALEVGVHSQVPGTTGSLNAGIYLESSDAFVTAGTGTRADAGLIIEGNTGWYHAISFYDVNAAILFDIDQYGALNAGGAATGYTKFNGNTQGVYPPFNSVKAGIGWNFSAGGGEVDWFNTQNTGSPRGFSWYQQTGASAATLLASLSGTTGALSPLLYASQTNCASGASPAVCAAAPSGAVAVAAAATTLVVDTTAVTANSEIVVVEDSGLGSRLGVTCNTQALTTLGAPRVTARSAGVSFTIGVDVGPTTNPMCVNYWIIN